MEAFGARRTAEDASQLTHARALYAQVSDAVVDACFAQDPNSHVACETCTGTNFVMVFGEITTNAEVDYEAVVREAIKDIGFDAPEKGLDYKTCEVRPPAFPLARLVYHTANRAVHLNSCRS